MLAKNSHFNVTFNSYLYFRNFNYLLYCDIVSAKINNPADSEGWRDKKLFLSTWLSCHFVVFIGHVGSTMSYGGGKAGVGTAVAKIYDKRMNRKGSVK